MNIHKLQKTLLPLAALSLLAATPISAQAAMPDEPGIYLGGGVGYNRLEGEDFPNQTEDVKDDNVSYKGMAGIRLNPVLAFEGQYINFGTAENGDNEIEATGWTAGTVLTLPMTDWIQPYAKVGALFWEADTRFGGFPRGDDGTDLTYGLGANIGLAEQLGLRLEFERFEMNDIDADMASANIVFNF